MRQGTPNERAARIARVAAAHGVHAKETLLVDNECASAVVWFDETVNVLLDDGAVCGDEYCVRREGSWIESYGEPMAAFLKVRELLQKQEQALPKEET